MDEYLEIALGGIEQGQCVLFLGPQFSLDASGNKINEMLKEHLRNERFDLVDDFENLYVFKDLNPTNIRKITLHAKMREFYNSRVTPHEIYKKIALIPFQAVITCTHDLLLKNAFHSQGIDVDCQYYAQKVNPDYHRTQDLPIVYNVFGNIDDKESLLNTYDKFSDFVIAMLSDNQMTSTELKHVIARSSVFIFIGFNLETWYFPLVLRKLKFYNESGIVTGDVAALVSVDNYSSESMGHHVSDAPAPDLDGPISPKAKRMYFPIELTFWDKDTVGVIDSVYHALEQRGGLRKKVAEGGIMIVKAKEMVAQNRIEDAIKMLMEAFDKVEAAVVNELIMLLSRYNRYKQDRTLNLINENEAKHVIAEITHAILQYADRLVMA